MGIRDIPKVLDVWRGHAGGTAEGISNETKPYAIAAGERAVNAQLKRLGLPGRCEASAGIPGACRVVYELTAHPMISILIPS